MKAPLHRALLLFQELQECCGCRGEGLLPSVNEEEVSRELQSPDSHLLDQAKLGFVFYCPSGDDGNPGPTPHRFPYRSRAAQCEDDVKRIFL